MDPHIADLAISPSGFVFDPRTGLTCSVNPAGLAVLEALRDGGDLPAIVDRLRGRFDVGETDLTRDVLDFVRSLRDAGLVDAGFELR
jgi:hypothetical protein